jgi:hypothetical protein
MRLCALALGGNKRALPPQRLVVCWRSATTRSWTLRARGALQSECSEHVERHESLVGQFLLLAASPVFNLDIFEA